MYFNQKVYFICMEQGCVLGLLQNELVEHLFLAHWQHCKDIQEKQKGWYKVISRKVSLSALQFSITRSILYEPFCLGMMFSV